MLALNRNNDNNNVTFKTAIRCLVKVPYTLFKGNIELKYVTFLKLYIRLMYFSPDTTQSVTVPFNAALARWVARLTFDPWIPASRAFEPHQRPPLFP